MPVYDEEKQKDLGPEALREQESRPNRMDDDGVAPINPDEQAALDQIEAGYGESADEPDTKSKDKSDSGDEGEGESLFRPNDKPRRRIFKSRATKRNVAIGGGLVGLMAGGTIWFATIVSGPAQVIQLAQILDRVHFSLNRNSSESRVGRMFEYFRTGNDKSRRNVGYTMEIISDHYKKGLLNNGIQMEFDRPSGNQSRRLQGLRVDTNSVEGQNVMDRLESEGFSVDRNTGYINLNQDADGVISTRRRRNALNIAVDLQKKGGFSTAISKRILSHRAGVDLHPLRNWPRDRAESLSNWYADFKERRAERVRSRDNPSVGRALDAENNGIDPESGEPIEDPASERLATEGNNEIDNARNAKTKSARLRVAGRLAGGTAAVVGVLCMVKSIGDDIPDYQHASIILPAVRMGMDILAVASQIQAGQDLNMDEVGAIVEDFYDEETQSSVWGAAAMQATQNQDVTGPDALVKPSAVGEKPQLFDIIDDIPFLGASCSTIDGFGSFVKSIPVVGSVVGLGESAIQSGINLALRPTGYSIEQLMEGLVAYLAGDVIDPLARGAGLGNIYAIGTLLAANEAAIATAGEQLSSAESGMIMEYQQEQFLKEQQQKPLFARIFDPYDSTSLVSSTLIRNPNLSSAATTIKSIASIPTKIVGLFSSGFTSLLPSTSAATTTPGYDFGVERYGFSQDDLDNLDYADPYENAEILEANGEQLLREMNSQYSSCFAVAINPDRNFALETRESVNYLEESYQNLCSRDDELFTRYRFYILDSIVAKSLACFEGIDEQACVELGFNADSSSEMPTYQGGVPLNGHILSGIQIDGEVDGCSGDFQPGARTIGDYVRTRWGKSYTGYNCRRKSTDSSEWSIHADGRAVDQFFNALDPIDLRAGNEAFGWLLANAESIGIQYVKFWKLQWSPARGLRCVTSAQDIQDHSNHIHYELNNAAAAESTPWFTNPTDNPPLGISQGLCT